MLSFQCRHKYIQAIGADLTYPSKMTVLLNSKHMCSPNYCALNNTATLPSPKRKSFDTNSVPISIESMQKQRLTFSCP